MTEKYSTQWAGQFFVAAELTRRGYIVTFTLGNAPTTDLLVKVPEGESFSVEVKTLREENLFPLSKPPVPEDPEDLFWFFVLLSEPPAYFIIRSDEVLRLWHEKNDKYPPRTSFLGLDFAVVKQYQDQWNVLPDV